jgi:hypothetical protein
MTTGQTDGRVVVDQPGLSSGAASSSPKRRAASTASDREVAFSFR